MKLRRQIGFGLVGLGALLLSQTAIAAPFDGNWEGESDAGTCQGNFYFRVEIADGKLSGSARLSFNRNTESPWTVTGSIKSNAEVTLRTETTDLRIPPPIRVALFRGKAEAAAMALAQDPSKSCGRKVTLKKK